MLRIQEASAHAEALRLEIITGGHSEGYPGYSFKFQKVPVL